MPLTQTESPGPWQSESLLAESWSTMGDMDPEDTKSLDSSDGAAQAGEENHSSNSDMVHLEREEAEMLEEAEEDVEDVEDVEDEDELQSSVLSVLGGEKELGEMRNEARELQAPETEGLLVSAEDPRLEKEPSEFMQVVPPMALPPLPIVRLHPPSTTSTPVPSTTTSEAEEPYITEGLRPPFIFAPLEPPTESPEQLKFSQIPLSDVEEHSTETSEVAIEKSEPQPSPLPKTTKPQSSTKRLFGGAALVAVVGVVAYGAIAFCRK
ncbi:bcl-2-like protein 13 [Notolabrus celidotus]|uniref:bcl-2-like protein 13 n=1 Tax=Notolabrus celidotus TaxID=1203425 RepID=UPI001490428E|nr:bcl-2-like protein 13 [Notolabrus celidotus]